MEDIAISIAAKLLEYLVGPVLREGRYLFCIGGITRDLQIEKEDLKSTLKNVENFIEEANTEGEKVDEGLMTWKNEVNEILIKVEDLQQQLQANNGCFRGWCPIWKRYHLCKQSVKKIMTLQLLNRKGIFVPDKNFLYFKATNEAKDKLIEAFKDDSCYIIGLYGMGGLGKTSLSIEVGNKAKKLRIFDHVIFTSVSQNPQIRMIQDQIKNALGFKFEETSESGRAMRQSTRMKSGERILIILDDVWKKLDFKEIGIPTEGEHHKGCKVLLTTRLQHVCTLMDCNTVIPLHLLSDEESWRLFIKNARINGAFSSSTMNEVAWGIVKECKGLPIAIVAVGNSLKGKSDNAWKLALDHLRHSELSYDYLSNEAAKLIMLLCSMFPEDHDIEVEDLFRYGIGLGICGQGDSFDMARRRVDMAITNLVESFLLTYSGEEKKKLKMHDLVRGVALWIASKEQGTILINQQNMSLDKLLRDEAVKDSFVISLWDLETENPISCELNAPKLKVLLLNILPHFPIDQVMNLSKLSFDDVKELKVLSIINSSPYGRVLLSLPQSTQWLTNLHTLRLRRMELGDISFVAVLRSLQILDLQYSELKELPNDIDKLNKLKLLDLSWCRIDESCDEVIRRCSQLEELYVHGDGAGINSYETLEMNDRLLKLQSYVIRIGQVTHSCIYTRYDLPKRVLYMAEFNISNPSKITIALLQRVSVVCLQNLQGRCKSFIPEMVLGSMKELTELYLIDCDEIECLVDKTTPHELGSCLGKINLCNLKCIEINNCANLASLFPIFVAQNLMNLEEMKLSGCSMLKHMIRNEESGINAAQEISDNSFLGQHEEHQPHHSQFQIHNLFPLLKTFELESLPCFLKTCEENYYPSWPSTKKQQLKPRTDVLNDKRMSDDVSTLPLSIFGLQHLQRLELVRCPQVKCVFSMDVLCKSLPCLTSLRIIKCDELEEIIFENNGEPQNMSDVEVCFPNLKYIDVLECNKLKTLFSSTIARMLPQLKGLTIENAAQLEEVFRHEAENNKDNIVLPNLETIRLRNLLILLDICQGIKLHAPKLNDIEILSCPKFAPVSEYLPHMTVEESHDEQVSNQQVLDLQIGCHVISTARRLLLIDLSNLIFLWKGPTLISFQSLSSLHVRQCSKLKTIFSTAIIKSLPQLETLYVDDCEELEEIVSNEEDKERQFLNPSNSHPQHVCFPKLKYLTVKKCNKLQCVFPMSMTRDVSQLEIIHIWDCSKLEHIFGSVHKLSPGFIVSASKSTTPESRKIAQSR